MFKIILIILIILLILYIYRKEKFTNNNDPDKPFVYAFNNRFKDDIYTKF